MFIFGVLSGFSSAICYSVRFAFVKKLSHFPNLHLNLFYRLASLPFIFLIIFFADHHLFDFQPSFLITFAFVLLFQFFFNYLQIRVLQKQPLSTVESLGFLDILFSTLIGIFYFHDRLSLIQMSVISIFILSFLYLYFNEHHRQKISLDIILYYLLVSVMGLLGKQTILLSSPITYVTFTTVGLVLGYLSLLSLRRQPFFIPLNNPDLFKVGVTGLLATLSFVFVGISYQYLPLGLVSVISSSKIFLSLFLSRHTFGETNLKPKIVVSFATFSCLPLLFLVK